MKHLKSLFSVCSLVCVMLAYGVVLHIAWKESEALSSRLDSAIKNLHSQEASLSAALKSEPKPLGPAAHNKVKKIFHDVRKKCDVIPETHDSLKVVRKLIHGEMEGAQDAYLEVRRPIGHVTAFKKHKHSKKGGVQRMVKYWRHQEAGKTFLCHGVNLTKNFLTVPKTGRYYVYSQVKFNYSRHRRASLHRHSTHLQPSGASFNTTVLENNYYLGGLEKGQKRSYKVSYHGAVLNLSKNSNLYVETRTSPHTKLVTDQDADTFFGMYMVS